MRGLLSYERYEELKKLVVEMFEEAGVNCLPIDCFYIARKLKYVLRPYSKLGDFNFAIGLAKNNVLYLLSNSEYIKGSYNATNLTFGSVTAPYTINDGELIVTYKGNKYTLTYTDDRLPAQMTEMDALTKSIVGRLAGEELQ